MCEHAVQYLMSSTKPVVCSYINSCTSNFSLYAVLFSGTSNRQAALSLLPSVSGGQSQSRRKAWTVSLEQLAVSDFFDPTDAVIRVSPTAASFRPGRTTSVNKQGKRRIFQHVWVLTRSEIKSEYFYEQLNVNEGGIVLFPHVCNLVPDLIQTSAKLVDMTVKVTLLH